MRKEEKLRMVKNLVGRIENEIGKKLILITLSFIVGVTDWICRRIPDDLT